MPRTLDLLPVDGKREVWRRIPSDRLAETWAWDAAGRGLWLVERGPDGLHVLHLAGPGEATEAALVAPVSPAAWIAALGPADTAMLFTSPAGEGPPVALVRADLATGAVTALVDDLGAALLAGWAAPPELPPGVTPPVPFGAPEVAKIAEDRPTAPDLPMDALAMVTCSANGTVVARPDVRALEDGVHILVRHPDGTTAGVRVTDGAPIDGYAVVSLPPGVHEIDCGEGPAPTPARLRVLDPAGLYRPAQLGCATGGGTASSMDGDRVPGPEAVAWLRPQLTLAPGDLVVPAGYPDEAGPPVTVVRAGRVVAIFRILRAGGALGIAGIEHCDDANVGP